MTHSIHLLRHYFYMFISNYTILYININILILFFIFLYLARLFLNLRIS